MVPHSGCPEIPQLPARKMDETRPVAPPLSSLLTARDGLGPGTGKNESEGKTDGQGGAREGYLFSGPVRALLGSCPLDLRDPMPLPLPESTGRAGKCARQRTHLALPAPLGLGETRLRPFHEPRAASAVPNPSRLHPREDPAPAHFLLPGAPFHPEPRPS